MVTIIRKIYKHNMIYYHIFQKLLKVIKMITPREEFIELMTENVKVNGLDDLSARIVAILFLEPREVSMEDLAKKTGYCLSSMSTGIKLMEKMGLITKFKKPPSKKIYLKMENDISKMLLNMLKKRHDQIIKRSKSILPGIIKKYKTTKSSREELKIIEHYYEDVLISENLINEMITKIGKMRRNND
jgi:DNA-binding transcriptional regulator GbsR (MarR family)